MILLATNCGFGNADCATLTIEAIDFADAWIQHPRPKTGVERRAKLWPETVEALRVVLAKRKEPKDEKNAKLIFITKRGGAWNREDYGSAITHEFDKILGKLKLKRPGVSFYTLRHVFATIAGGSRDQVAVNQVMGHVDSSMAATYREQIDDDRLIAVSENVRRWLFAEPKTEKEGAAPRLRLHVEPEGDDAKEGVA